MKHIYSQLGNGNGTNGDWFGFLQSSLHDSKIFEGSINLEKQLFLHFGNGTLT